MNRRQLALMVSILVLVPDAMKAEEPTQDNARPPVPNQVYVKVIMPGEPEDRDADRIVVESWIAEDLTKRGQTQFTAVTKWVKLESGPFDATDVWRGDGFDDVTCCPVGADIPERAEGRIKVLLIGWSPGGATATAVMPDEPGRRAIVAVEEFKMAKGMPYVAVLIGPPAEEQ